MYKVDRASTAIALAVLKIRFLGKVSKRIFLRGKPPTSAGVGAVVKDSPL
jgi:hypothetical protein